MQNLVDRYLDDIRNTEENVIVNYIKRTAERMSEEERQRLSWDSLDNIRRQAYTAHPEVVARQKATLASSNVRFNS